MATAPGPPQNVKVTALGNGTASFSWSAPANNGGAAIQSYYLSASPFIITTNTPDSNGVTLGVSGITGTTYNATGLTPTDVYTWTVQAYNGVGYSDATPSGAAGGHGDVAGFIPRAAATVTSARTQTIGVGEGNTPLITPPSAFGVTVRLAQAVDYVFSQLTSQTGRTDPDTQNVDPSQVVAVNQPIIRLAMGTSDVLAQATDSQQLAGEIASGALASTRAVVGHTSGSSSFTLTKTWTADRAAQIYTMAVTNNLPIGYAPGGPLYQASGTIGRTLIWTYDIPTPIGVANGDSFTTTVTVTF